MLGERNLSLFLSMYCLSGVNPQKVGRLHDLIFLLALSSNITIIVMTVLFFSNATDLTLTDAVEPLESLLLLCHGFVKLVGLYIGKPKLGKLVKMLSDFRRIDNVDDREVKKACVATTKTFRTLTGLYVFIAAIVVFEISIMPIFEHNLIWACYIPEKMSYYQMTALQIYVYITSVFIPCLGVDFLYMTLVSHLKIQFQLLNHHVKRMIPTDGYESETEIMKRMKDCVDYHNFLLDFVKLFNDTFSIMLFFYFGTITLATCTELFLMSIQPDGDVLKYYSYICILFFEFIAFYCFPGQIVTDEAEKLTETIWEITWYENPSPLVRTGMNMTLMQSQRPVFIKAGIINADYLTVHSCLKTIVSYYMFLKTMSDNNSP